MQNFVNFFGNVCKICEKFDENLLKFCVRSGAKEQQSDRSRQELSNEYLIAKIGFDTAENEPSKVCPLSVYRSPRYDTLGVGPLFNAVEDLIEVT